VSSEPINLRIRAIAYPTRVSQSGVYVNFVYPVKTIQLETIRRLAITVYSSSIRLYANLVSYFNFCSL